MRIKRPVALPIEGGERRRTRTMPVGAFIKIVNKVGGQGETVEVVVPSKGKAVHLRQLWNEWKKWEAGKFDTDGTMKQKVERIATEIEEKKDGTVVLRFCLLAFTSISQALLTALGEDLDPEAAIALETQVQETESMDMVDRTLAKLGFMQTGERGTRPATKPGSNSGFVSKPSGIETFLSRPTVQPPATNEPEEESTGLPDGVTTKVRTCKFCGFKLVKGHGRLFRDEGRGGSLPPAKNCVGQADGLDCIPLEEEEVPNGGA
jgi:hypothetical protein